MKYTACALILLMICAGCVTQSEVLTIDQWKDHLTVLNPPLGEDPTSMVTGVLNSDTLPVGTRITFFVTLKRIYHSVETATTMTMTAVVSKKEYIDDIECTVFDITMDMHMTLTNESMDITITGTEWIDSTGAPVKVKENIIMKFNGMEFPAHLVVTRKAEGTFHGHECWVYTGTQTMGVGDDPDESSIIEYMEKKSFAIIQTITSIGGETVNTGYIPPPVALSECVWELYKRERITTEAGRYNCQVIHVKEGDTVVATFWAHDTVRVPIQYTYEYHTKESDIQFTMTLTEYSLGKM